jgi:cytochrome P450
MVYYTAKHPEWQKRLQEEYAAIDKEHLSYEDLDKLPLTDLVFQECLRMHPSVPILSRRTLRECEIGGYSVPANTVLWIPPTYNHRMPAYWTKPDQFDPERFTAERAEHKNHSFCYLPFGGGAHKCIGMHFAIMVAKTFMFQFVKTFEYATPENYDPKMDFMPLPKPHDGVPLSLKRRS